MVITKQATQKFLEDYEQGDILAITNLIRTQPLKDCDSSVLHCYLDALENLNGIMTDMEEGIIPYDSEFNDLYRKAMELMCNKCKQILKEV